MNNNLIKADEYCIITFDTTSYALKAEAVLKQLGAEFIIMPTLREITASCGLSVKITPENLEPYYDMLSRHNVAIKSAYHVQKKDRKNYLEKLM